MKIKCKILRQVFANWESHWRAIACVPVGDPPPELILNEKYGTFTLCGVNINYLRIGETVELDIAHDKTSKYPDSYTLVCMPNIDMNGGKILVHTEDEMAILERFMTNAQAKNVHDAYPNFVQMIMDGKESEIDHKKIKNVAAYRRQKYIEDIIKERDYIMMYPIVKQYGLTEVKYSEEYKNPDEFIACISKNPYHVYIDIYELSFPKADILVKRYFANFIDSDTRCVYATEYYLKEVESLGHTRIKDTELAELVMTTAHECVKKMPQVVTENPLFTYDKTTHQISLTETYNAEKNIAEFIKRKIENPLITKMDTSDCINVDGFTLTNEQAKILEFAQNYSIAMLTGASGTGKSSSVKALIKMLENNGMSYQMLAPTGTAAKVLSRYTQRHAMTIHKFIFTNTDCFFDYYIIDECSMVGVHLLSNLIDIIDKNDKDAKFIFICDPAQLPSISCGNIVEDFIKSNKVPLIQLTKTFRYNTSGLITIATDTRMGNSESMRKEFPDYHFCQIEEYFDQQIEMIYKEVLQQYNKEDILILSPFNKYDMGTRAINNLIQEKFNHNPLTDVSIQVGKTKIGFKIGDRVINKKNKYNALICDENYNLVDKTVFIPNGDIGIVKNARIENNVAQMIIEFDDGLVLFEGSDISHLLLGYAVSIHASQGGQAKCVIVILGEQHERLLSRNIQYVAFTRAQEQLYIVGDYATIHRSMQIEEQNERHTWLRYFLKMENNNG